MPLDFQSASFGFSSVTRDPAMPGSKWDRVAPARSNPQLTTKSGGDGVAVQSPSSLKSGEMSVGQTWLKSFRFTVTFAPKFS